MKIKIIFLTSTINFAYCWINSTSRVGQSKVSAVLKFTFALNDGEHQVFCF